LPSLRPEDGGLDTPKVENTPTRLLQITVEEDGSLTQSGLPVLDKAQLPQNLVTFINQAFSSNHSPPYLGPGMQVFPDVERLTKSFLAPGNVVLILVRDLADGKHIGPSDFIASFGLITYQHPVERPDPIKNPHSSSTVYIDSNGRESIRCRLCLHCLNPFAADRDALTVVLKTLAVNQSLQGHGIGTWMVGNLLEREAVARARLAGR